MTQFRGRLFGGKLYVGKLFRGPDAPQQTFDQAGGGRRYPQRLRRRNRDLAAAIMAIVTSGALE